MALVPQPRAVTADDRRDLVRRVDQLVSDLVDRVEHLARRPDLGTADEAGIPAPFLSRLQALGEIAAAIECAADQAAYWAGQAGASYQELAQAWDITPDEANLRWNGYGHEVEGL